MKKECCIRAFESNDLPVLHEIREAPFKPVFQSFRDLVGKDIAAIALENIERAQGAFLDTICEKFTPHNLCRRKWK